MKRTFVFLILLVPIPCLFAQTDGVDSMAYYNGTKKPAISEAVVEYAPTIQADGKTIIYQRGREGKRFELYETRLEKGKWTKGVALTKINSFGDSTDLFGGPSISFDGNVLYFFRSVGMQGDHEIFYSNRTRDGWTDPINIGSPINTKPEVVKNGKVLGGYEAFPSVSADGSTLYFVRSNEDGPMDKALRKEGAFCLSIYKSEKDREGHWMKPEKLPWPINQECEKGPRIMADGRTLIFSSNRPGGKGGYDMYQSHLNDLDEWTMPEPLDYVNTEKDDQLPCISAEGDLMYYTYNNNDIYSVVIPPKLRQFMNNIVQGYVTDMDNHSGIASDIIVTDALTSEKIMQLESNAADGRYTLVLPVGRNYNLEFVKPGFSSFAYALDLKSSRRYQEKNLDVQLFKSVKLTVNVSDREIFEPIGATIRIHEKGKEEIIREAGNNPHTGMVSVELPVGKQYEVAVTSSNFKNINFDFDVSGLVIYRNFEKFIELLPDKVEVMVNVSDLVNNSKVKSKVLLKNKSRDEVIEVNGNQLVSLRAGDRYEMEVTSDQGYAFNSAEIDVTKGVVPPIEVKLMKLEVNAKLTLRDIMFESNSVKLSDVSFDELKRVVQLMRENPKLRVEVAAHTDDLGSENYNLVLSQKRARSVADYLLNNRISPSRFEAKGYGESQKKVANDSEANRAINRRVELKILGI